jgi:hypothetical protein
MAIRKMQKVIEETDLGVPHLLLVPSDWFSPIRSMAYPIRRTAQGSESQL